MSHSYRTARTRAADQARTDEREAAFRASDEAYRLALGLGPGERIPSTLGVCTRHGRPVARLRRTGGVT